MNHPLSDMMMSSMGKIRDMIDVNTVIGEPIAAGDVTIIPVTKVSIGYGAGGSDFATKNYPANRDNAFGGGAGAGVNITPVAFLVVRGESVRMLPVAEPASTSMDRLIEQLPDLLDKAEHLLKQKRLAKEEASNNFPRMKPARRGKLTPGDNNEARLFQNGGGCGRCRFPVSARAGSKFFRQRQREERNSGGRADRQSSV